MSTATSLSYDKIVAKLRSSFNSHLELTYNRCVKVRTIFSADEFVEFKSFYVSLKLSGPSGEIFDSDIINDDALNAVAVSGTGGAGKTMLMRYIALSILEEERGRVPLFVELRNLPKCNSASFYQTIFDSLTPERDQENFNIFKEGLRNGIFVLLIDGLDEVQPAEREEVYRAIQRIPLDFPSTKVIVSTRPEIDVRPWEYYNAYSLKGLNKEQTVELIQKIDYPIELKQPFLDMLTPQFLHVHRTFLSVPLLCTLMLLTYHEFKEIPSRITVFYEQAFETLLRRHDRGKEGYFKRELLCGLPSDRFKALLAAFCYRTSALSVVSFSDERLREHIARAAQVTEIEVDVDKYASDLVSSVCLIMRDGLNLHFIHRSFQDYFAAQYILRYKGPDVTQIYDRVIADQFINNVAQMAADLDLKTFEREWALPAIVEMDKYLKNKRKSERWYHLLKMVGHELRVDGDPPNHVFAWSWTTLQKYRRPLGILSTIYGGEYRALSAVELPSKVKTASSLCELEKKGVILPEEVSDACSDGYDEDDYVEVNIENMPRDWIKETFLFDHLEECLLLISKLRKELEARSAKRETISLLS